MTRTTIVNPEALPAWHHLGGVLTDLRGAGRLIPCWSDPAPYTSEDFRERAEAARACAHCPALDACARYADDQGETAHVWAGIDRTDRKPRRVSR